MSAFVPRLGPRRLDDTHTLFRLWAPSAQRVELLLDNAPAQTMSRDADSLFHCRAEAGTGQRYRFRIDGRYTVPDPASRWQPEGVHGPSALLDERSYRWQHANWQGRPWHEAVIYELHVGTCGGYDGVIAQLPQLARWGITAIELMPLASVPGERNWGYDGVLPYAPHAALGHPDRLKALIDAAHGFGLMVFADVVYNHFGPDGNALPGYAAAFFRDDRHTPWGPAIDFDQPMVQRYFADHALSWLLDYRFDGLRLDAVHALEPRRFLQQLSREVRLHVTEDRHVHLMLENENNESHWLDADYVAQWNDDFHNALHVMLTGETYGYYANFADNPARHLARVLKEGFAYQGEVDARDRRRGEPSAYLPSSAFIHFAQNHDQVGNRALGERLISLVGAAHTRLAMALTALCPMIPLFFMGEPWGHEQPFLFFTDFAPPLDQQVRDGRRREFTDFPGFADPQRRALIPDPNDRLTFLKSRAPIEEADGQRGTHWLAFFQGLLQCRQQYTAALNGARGLQANVLSDQALHASWRLGDGRELAIAFNAGDTAATLPAPHRTPVAEILYALNTDSDALLKGKLPPGSLLAWWPLEAAA
ncbi:malto-oligosyltrehalose trehalohydrolase [Oleiagrimonas sp. C23AA]|uniref:malto-oligosyltrehalose trehalohydrolase n=1 Tax=Oleiagrimonas sp. C23AA TaxID=2719047 RepID=UPI00141F924C|nr:malto-oligosyltrehalose trehalohydrolase [Oleiagrimonas sp. C23AA]NII11133.1 malto-oligosyltrehalose trehalohydrolase [Oleiagrimonas sp. C23AA]